MRVGKPEHYDNYMDRITKFGEDTSPVRCTSIPQVMTVLRNMALSVLRIVGYKTILKKL